ncbi:TetR/AcrR family transcriptional regulator [Bacillus mesophilum]|uniref:TetR family transcriptional regulator n=1 Tax=Bacillus mesophilum TaxID=1071718 RepID=A0A7V7RIT6_9BACI|nr:TetR/AcrR family transcriptional regulator [Bacillus mesophilum]KAB2330311.1 TetR family transcriptional regulator [Bacillus mesophilum]
METYIDKRIQRSTHALKSALLKLLVQKPFHHIKISDIIREANYNRGTFYAHFKSKEQLLQSIIDDTLKDMIEHIRSPYKNLETVQLAKLNSQDITLFQYIIDHVSLYKVLLSEHIQVDFRHQMALAIEQLFIEEYEYADVSPTINTKWLYIYRSHGIAGLIIRWIEEGFQTEKEEMAQQVIELMLVSTDVFRVKR